MQRSLTSEKCNLTFNSLHDFICCKQDQYRLWGFVIKQGNIIMCIEDVYWQFCCHIFEGKRGWFEPLACFLLWMLTEDKEGSVYHIIVKVIFISFFIPKMFLLSYYKNLLWFFMFEIRFDWFNSRLVSLFLSGKMLLDNAICMHNLKVE